MTSTSKPDLADLIGKALAIADDRGLTEVGLHLDQALIALTGTGVAPPETFRPETFGPEAFREVLVTEFS